MSYRTKLCFEILCIQLFFCAIFSEHELIKRKPIYRSLRSVDEKIIEDTSQLSGELNFRISLGQMKSD
ncbi:hypothetical protein RCL_jg11710.t1 [Rhizophagus clarus]|uniref:Uncharacterized protein n=1 Tax=Rhizophagus clarus TaxID=94130 RepID=A0A8H3MBC0_9GLOM|nr:hypothetical protein RCL_jg11710.t1 [Rhizophagus clarus]